MININIKVLKNETFEDYRMRITEHKDELGLSWNDIKTLCSENFNVKVSDNWRKFYSQYKKNKLNEYDGLDRILAISDVHVPYNLPIDIFSKYIGKVDTLIINGDLIDCYSLSKFTKMYRQPLVDELIKARQYVIDLHNMIKPKRIVAITGNHELRLGNVIANKIGTDMSELLPTDAMAFIFDTGFNHYDHLTKTKMVYEPLCDTLECDVVFANNWWYKYGNALFMHPMAFKNQTLSTPIKAYEYFIGQEEFDTIVMAHTHKVGFGVVNGKYLYEQGTCSDSKFMKYMEMRLPKERQQCGYLYLCQKEGKIYYPLTNLEVINDD